MGLLLMLLTFGAIGLSAVLVLGLVILKKFRFAFGVIGLLAAWIGVYAAILLTTSFLSSETILPIKETKRYCGFYLDCHMATAVNGVQRLKEYKGKTANGTFYVVDIEVSSDARRATLRLLSPEFEITDSSNNKFKPVPSLSTPTRVFEKRIGAEERINGEVVFDLPESTPHPRLDIRQADPIDYVFESLLIGDEDSLFHKRTYFSLESGK